jgi:hypothetical protein
MAVETGKEERVDSIGLTGKQLKEPQHESL